jgi:Cryptococcal mannosyltransferase 1
VFLLITLTQTEDALTLLNTNDGEYAAACAMDYARPPEYYDTFALRDADGAATFMQTWPYFRSSASRAAVKRNRPVPVASCWNGMGRLVLFPSLHNVRGSATLDPITGGVGFITLFSS